MTAKISGYQPGRLLDVVREKLGILSDLELARQLQIEHAHLSKIRNKRAVLSPDMFLRLHDECGLSIGDMRELAGLPRRMYIGA